MPGTFGSACGYRAQMTRIGFTGVGRMGLPMCANLVRAGYQVTAGDARGERESAVTGCRAQWKGTAAEVAAEADVLITVLPGPGEVHDVMAGRGGVPAVLSDRYDQQLTGGGPGTVPRRG